ncbi:cytochrome c oxidase assembly protein [Cognatishimia activa]|uniref:cytochrome c oxidase assembly protein n=1 Tax=Cognatishimia activa TaxID=1715691 RepID=UPI0022309A3D|nr:cytochrome c oxidase assembly protein [Cognatishimia activa]UZD91781.1 cytochrome c oxidase assembly protein [Cognatishimia activa]
MDKNAKTVLKLAGVGATMLGLAFASVPFYDWFCRVTGFGGITQQTDAGSEMILDQTIKVKFDASKDRNFDWEFKPQQLEVELKIGETGLAFYEAYNPTDRPIAGQASFNVAPYEAGAFFSKIECFCFTEQVLMPGERIDMPVTFFVDPEITEDRDAKYVKEIILSYTFHEIDLPEEMAALTHDGLAVETETKETSNEG